MQRTVDILHFCARSLSI